MPLSADPKPTSIKSTDFDSRLLRYFLAVVREGSVRRASEILHVAASAISRQISDVETRLGLQLLERLPRGVVPTEAGLAIADFARQQMEDGDRLVDHLRKLHGLRQGAVRISSGEGFVGDLLENGLRPFSVVYPDIRLQLLLATTSDILTAVAESTADIGLIYNPPSQPGVRSAAISRQPMCLIVPPGHPRSDDSSVSLKELASEKVALLTMQHGTRQLLGLAEADLGIRLVPEFESNAIDVVRRYVMLDCGVTLLPRFAVATEIAEGRLKAIPMIDPVLAAADAHLIVRSQRRLPNTVEQMVAFLTARLEAFRGGEANMTGAGANP